MPYRFNRTLPLNTPPHFCVDDGRELQEFTWYEENEYDPVTGVLTHSGAKTIYRSCHDIHHPMWSLKEGETQWVGKGKYA